MRALDLSGDWVWLLDLTWPGPGATTRLSSRPVSVDNPSGTQWLYQGGIPALRVTTEAPFADVSVGMRTVSLAGVPLDHDLVKRFPLAASAFELSYWKVGTPWTARVPVLTGTVKAATWGAEGQGVTLELAEQPIEDRALLLRGDWAINDTDWPDAPEGSLGEIMPLVFGSPGVYRDGGVAKTAAGSPAILVDETVPRLLIAGHPVEAENVTIYTPDAGDGLRTAVKAVSRVYKGGRYVSVVDLTPGTLGGGGTVTGSDFGELAAGDVLLETLIGWSYHVIWDQGGGGLPGENGRALTSAGELLEWTMRRSSIQGDWARFRLARRWLDGMRIDTYVDVDDLRPWDLIRQVLLPLLPVTLLSGPRGVYPVVWRLEAETHQRVRLVEGVHCWRVSRPEPADLGEVSEVRVAFAQGDEDGETLATVVLTGDPHAVPGQDGVSTCARSRQGWARYGEAGVVKVDAGATWDRQTAWRIAHWRVAAAYAPRDVVEVNLAPELAGLEPGDGVVYTDADLGITARHGEVQAITWASTYVRAAILLAPWGG